FKRPLFRCESAGDESVQHVRFRLGPGRVDVGLGICVKRRGAAMVGDPVELVANLGADLERDAYERLIEAALAGDHTLDERAEGAMAAGRIVEPILDDRRVFRYEPGSWGPAEASRVLPRGARWFDPRSVD